MAAGGDNEVNVKFGATIDDLKSKMGEVSGIFGHLIERFGALAAVVGGGAAFKQFIDTADRLNTSAEKVSRTLGISATEAGAINMAIDDVAASMGIGGATAETYTGAFLKFNRQLRMNSDSLRALGVDVDAVKNGTKTSNEVFQEAVQIVGKYAPGIDQTQIAMQLFGRSVQDVQLLMGITAEKIEEARKKAESLNLTITTEGVEGARAYRSAMNDVHDVLEGLQKTVGEGVMPIFTNLAKSVADIGPALVEGMKGAVETLVSVWNSLSGAVEAAWSVVTTAATAIGETLGLVFGEKAVGAMQLFRDALGIVQVMFIGFRIGVEEIVNVVKTGLALMSNGFVGFASVAERALHLDFAGAKAEWEASVRERNRILQDGVDKALAIAAKGRADMDAINLDTIGTKKGTAAPAPTGGTKRADIGKPDTGNGGEKLAAELALKKAALIADLALDQEHLKEAQAIYDEAFKNNLLSIGGYYDAKLEIEKKSNDLSLAEKRKELDQAAAAEKAAEKSAASSATPQDKAKYDTQALKFKTEQVKLQGEINLLEAQGVEASRAIAAERADAERKLADDLATIKATRTKASADDEIQTDTAVLEQKKALRQIDADDAFNVQKQIEEKSYAATLEQIEAKRALIHGDQANAVKERAQLDADAEAAERQHQQKLSAIDRAAELERAKYSIQAQQSVQTSFSTMVNDLLSGTKKISDVFRQFGISVANTFTNLIAQKFTDRLFDVTGVNKAIDKMVSFVVNGIAKMVAKWVGGEAANTAATTAGAANRTAVATGETTQAIATTATETASVVTAEGTKTAAKAAATTTAASLDATAAATALTTQQTTTIAAILGYAAEAAVAAMASVAAIPFVGWAMAPEVGAATYATGLAYLASAAGGWDEIPHDQIAQVHKKEMILSAPLAEGLRNLVGDGGITPLQNTVGQIVNKLGPGGQSGDQKVAQAVPVPAGAATSMAPRADVPAANQPWWHVPASPLARIQSSATAPQAAGPAAGGAAARPGGDIHLHLNTIDSKDTKRWLQDNSQHVADAIRKHVRNGGTG